MKTGPFSPQELASYQADGYVLVRELFDAEEISLLSHAAKQDRAMDQHAMGRRDGEGGTVRLSVWNQPGEGIYGMIARCRRMVDRVEQLLDDEAYHYHSKMIMKDPQVGGAWAWHQDYGYWYYNGVLAPNLCSVFVAVDRATQENGCLQVLRGSHQLGRIDHTLAGDQAGADLERVAVAQERLDTVHCQLEPGDAIFFHANLLHRSDQNRSDKPRWSMVCCYNARSNDPYKESRHPRYTPLEKVDDTMVKEVGRQHTDEEGTVTWLEDDDNTARRMVQEQTKLKG